MGFQLATPVQPEATRRETSDVARNLLLAIPFLLLCYIQLAHHVMWRDELNALAITWASPTIPSLFWHIHHEGHPWLWYVILWVPSRFTQSVLVLKFVQAIVSTSIILLVALRAPFRTWEKALILGGYFFVFEYTVMSRMYGVMLLVLLLYLDRRVRKTDSPVGSAVLLGLMASTDSLGIILSVALILEYACAIYMRGKPLFTRKTAGIAVATYAAILAFALWTAKPAKDISWRTTGRPFKDATSVTHLYMAFLRYTILPFVPVKSPRSHFFWNPLLHLSPAAYTLPMLVILALLYRSFRGRWNLLMMIGATILAGTILGHLIYQGSERHFGVVFLSFVAAAWLLRASVPEELLPWAVYFLLSISALSSVWAVAASFDRPFSNDRAAAHWIVQNHLEGIPFVSDLDTSATAVAAYLHRPVYMIECSCVDTYLLFSSRRDNYTEAEAPQRILQAAHYYRDAPMLFMSVFPMKTREAEELKAEGFQIQPLASFEGAEENYENFYFYRLTLTKPTTGLR